MGAVPPKSKCRWSSRLFYSLYNHFSESSYALTTERFSIISRRAINRVSSYGKTIPYRKAIYAESGLRIAKLNFSNTIANGKRYSDIEKSKTAVDSLILFTDLAYKVSLLLATVMAIFMISTGIYTVVMYFGQKRPVEGWAPLMGLISAGFLAMFVLATIIIKYLDVALRLIFKKQKYLMASIEKL